VNLSVALGRYPHTEAILSGAIATPGVTLDFVPLPTANRAFAPMVRESRYDLSEMAIATFLMAKAHGKPLVLLPVAVAARFQESALFCLRDGPVKRPEDLRGKRIGVRSYSQTTAMWLRGVLAERHGVPTDSVRWITFEPAHVAEATDPPCAQRAPEGAELMAMLKAGEVDAAIFGNDLPADPAITTVFPDPAAAGEAFRAAHGFVPVNHLVCVTRALADSRPEIVAALCTMFRTALAGTSLPTGRDALAAPIALAIRYCAQQGLLPRPLTPDAVWDGLPAEIR
jgi:4,5-dihydroxyphthalate decarboxylase